jgi:hypothetical protein
MSLIISSNKKVVKYPFLHDPMDEKYYPFVYRPKERVSSTEYLLDDTMRPSMPNGFYYVCMNPGISASTEPTFATKANGKTTDGTVIWLAVPWNLMLNTGDSITASTFSASVGVTLADPSFDDGVCSVKVVDTGALALFTLTNHITILRKDGKVEQFDRSIDVTVGEL